MQLDPIAQQTLLSALRNTQSQKLSPTEKLPDPDPLPQDKLSASESSEELSYKPCPELVGNAPGEPATANASGAASHAAESSEARGVALGTLGEQAREALTQRGLSTEYSPEALEQVKAIGGPPPIDGPGVRDLRHLAWASIDNVDTRDIDQLAYAEDLGEGKTRLLVAIADVAEAVPKDSAIDLQARHNTVTVYTTGRVFNMLPEQLSTDWTSLGPGVDRRALVTEMVVNAEGQVESSQVYQAAVHNRAKLAYTTVSSWLEGESEAPPAVSQVPGKDEQVRLQIEVGQRLGRAAAERGALEFEADRVLPVVQDGRLVDLVEEKKNLASEAVAHMMIATNTANAAFLHQKGFPVFQRVVEPPQRWDRMREVAVKAASELPDGKEMPSELAILPPQPDPAALSRFLRELKQRDPKAYPEVSGSLLKLMGGGDYVVTPPGHPLKGHFGQGVLGGEVGYVHSTAPNRRLPDIVIQRMIKAATLDQPCPYTAEELQALAEQCNQQESAAKGAERQVRKAAVAQYLTSQVGQQFEAAVTGCSAKKGVFIKVLDPPIEGKLVEGVGDLDVGDHLRVELRRVDPDKGHIDFVPVQSQ